jgi:UDP-2-acetamido-3-amino-2,3-dideoxy-glucuronate N-acetyltransferase
LEFAGTEVFLMMKLAIIGAGKWGVNHVRTAQALLGKDLSLVCDVRESVRRVVAELAPLCRFTTDLEEVRRSDVGGVIIAAPAEQHFEIARQMLESGKACLVEKPITLFSDQARQLVALAQARQRTLMVGHVLLYHPAVLEMKRRIDQGLIGNLQYIYSNRLNLGSIRSEENILWSFAPHDIAVIQYFLGVDPIGVWAKGASFVQRNIEDTTVTHLSYPNNIHAHIFVSWLHPFKEQRMVVTGSRGMIVFEDTAKADKLRFYPKGFETGNGAPKKFDGDYIAIPFGSEEPLAAEHQHFYECVRTGRPPRTDGQHALAVLEILEKAQRCLKPEATEERAR